VQARRQLLESASPSRARQREDPHHLAQAAVGTLRAAVGTLRAAVGTLQAAVDTLQALPQAAVDTPQAVVGTLQGPPQAAVDTLQALPQAAVGRAPASGLVRALAPRPDGTRRRAEAPAHSLP